MNVNITPAPLTGIIPAIPSKSAAHRLLICAALADKPTRLLISGSSADIEATVGCLRALGAKIEQMPEGLQVTPIAAPDPSPLLDCGESGSTLRFLVPVAAVVSGHTRFTGHGRLPARPIDHLRTALEAHGASFSAPALPFAVSGRLRSGHYRLPGNVSSQYITGLLFALPLLEGDSQIELTTSLESRAYVDMTLSALAQFGIRIKPTDTGWLIPGGQRYRSPGQIAVEGDWSNAAFYLAAGAIGAPCTVVGVDINSGQGDARMLDLLRRFGARVECSGNSVTVSPERLQGITADVSEIPDLLPILAVVAASAAGESRFTNAARLRLKESDRLQTTAAMLTALGASVTEESDSLTVRGGTLTGGVADGCNDHRIVMAAAIAAIVCSAPVTVTGAEAADKSYPTFFADYKHLGGIVRVDE